MSEANDAVLARTQSARSTTPERSTTPGSSVPSALDRAGTIRAIASAYAGSAARRSAAVRPPGARARRPIAYRSTAGQSTRPSRAASAPSAGRRRSRRPQGGADEDAGLPARSSRQDGLRSRRVIRPATRARRRRHRGSPFRTAVPPGRETGGVAGRQLAMTCGRPTLGRRLQPVDAQQLGERGRGGRGRIDDRHALPDDALDDRAQQRIVGAAQQQRVDGRAGRAREDRFAVGVAFPEQRGQAGRDRGFGTRAALLPRPSARGPAWRARRPRPPVLVLDRVEVGVRADGRRRGDDPDAGCASPGRRRTPLAGSRRGPAGRSAGGTPRCPPRWRCCRPRRGP